MINTPVKLYLKKAKNGKFDVPNCFPPKKFGKCGCQWFLAYNLQGKIFTQI